MLATPTPTILLRDQLRELERHLPGIRFGDGLAIHDARVASRRIRELLPLCQHESGSGDDLYRVVHKLGRALGRVRELDIEIDLLSEFEHKVPHAGSLLAVRRDAAETRKARRLRRLVKELPDRLSRHHRLLVARTPRLVVHDRLWPATWRFALRDRLDERRTQSERALAHAGGVYFPNRLHGARIALKKLRYTTEIGEACGLIADPNRVLRRIRRAQDLLGEIHDRQLLLDALTFEIPSTGALDVLLTLLRSEIQERHRRFLMRQPDLVHGCHSLRIDHPTPLRRAVPAATAAAMTGLWLLRQARR